MKTKYWTVSPADGAVSLVGPFSRGLSAIEVQAATKSEATAMILARSARQAAAGGPRLFLRNGAYCLATHDGNVWSAEAGTTHARRANSDGSMLCLCSGGAFDDVRKAPSKASFDYYASDDFQHNERLHYGANGSVEAELLATLKELTAAVGAMGASEAARAGLVMPHACATALLGKLTGSKTPAGQSAA